LSPSATIEIGRVLRCEDVAPEVALLRVDAPQIAAAYRPGCFVHVKTGDAATILRRPLSIARAAAGQIELLFRVVGAGTAWLRARRKGDALDLMGPLGNCFIPRGDERRALLVAGGLGLAPLLGLAEALQRGGDGSSVEGLVGVRTKAEVFPVEVLGSPERVPWQLATDDGSAGFHGTVVELLRERLDAHAADEALDTTSVYAAGPPAMLAATARLCAERGLALQVTLEAHMGCGVGACRACGIVRYVDREKLSGRVCKEGPVFDASEILWEEMEW
jgi:dihydroorotate dehydrogenase electron transfer subunit